MPPKAKPKPRVCGARQGTGTTPNKNSVYGVSVCGCCNGKGTVDVKVHKGN